MLRLRRGTACAADCAAETVLLAAQTELPQLPTELQRQLSLQRCGDSAHSSPGLSNSDHALGAYRKGSKEVSSH